jgi:hypothetical protein
MNQHARYGAGDAQAVKGNSDAVAGARKHATVGFWPAAIVVSGLILNLVWIAGLGWLAIRALLWAAGG